MDLRTSLIYEPVELTFGTSGLRGLVDDMTDLECYINAGGFIEFLKQHDDLQNDETIYVAGDLRDSTPRITQAVMQAVYDAGHTASYFGQIPTPALAHYSLQNNAPCIMVTGSHIPSDRNGIKFYKRGGEILKSDEAAIHEAVATVRSRQYSEAVESSSFTNNGSLKHAADLPDTNKAAEQTFVERYRAVFKPNHFAGKKVVMYQHSAVGRDLIVSILKSLGAEVIPVERSDDFVPIDTENVTEVEQRLFKGFSDQYPDAFAIVSTDGDSDRPFVIDEHGVFHRGDVLGLIVTNYLKAKFAAVPISANDAVDSYCKQSGIELVHTRIGSPYVIDAMQAADTSRLPVGWEVNGGFLTGTDIELNGGVLKALPTRDATLPILVALASAADAGTSVSELFAQLPERYTGAGLIDVEQGQVDAFKQQAADLGGLTAIAQRLFAASDLGELGSIDNTDGLRMRFASGQVLHLRPSGNAPQFRVYTNTDSQDTADQLVADAIAPDGHIERLLEAVSA